MAKTAASPDLLSADDLLRIPEDQPEKLFPPDLSAVSKIFHTLAKAWHPDRNHDVNAGMVLGHVTKLRDEAKKRLEAGTWSEPNTLKFKALDGVTYRVHYDKMHSFELGNFYIGPSTVAFLVRKEHEALFRKGVREITSLAYADDKMRKTISVLLPGEHKVYETAEHFVLLVKKDPEAVLLADLLKHQSGKLDPKHAAWIMTRLHNMACYLEWAGLTHNAIDAGTLFVNPQTHNVSLLGGWWHAARKGEKLQSLPAYAADFMPDSAMKSGKATPRVDLELIRAVGRELLGDRGGTRFAMTKPAPDPFLNWLRRPSTGDAMKDLGHWDSVLKESFGPRRFVKFNTTYNDVYQPGG